MNRTVRNFLILSLLLAACENDPPPAAGEAASLTDVANMCDEWLGWRARCQAERQDPSFYEGDFYERCKADPRWSLVSSAATHELETCFQSLSCDGNDDRCLGQAITNLGIDYQNDAVYKRCMPKAKECEGVLQDSCADALLYHDQARELFAACLELPCDQMAACIKNPANPEDAEVD